MYHFPRKGFPAQNLGELSPLPTESYFPEFKQATLEMIRAQGGIVGWTAKASQVLAGLKS